jgi:hypothetical protein
VRMHRASQDEQRVDRGDEPGHHGDGDHSRTQSVAAPPHGNARGHERESYKQGQHDKQLRSRLHSDFEPCYLPLVDDLGRPQEDGRGQESDGGQTASRVRVLIVDAGVAETEARMRRYSASGGVPSGFDWVGIVRRRIGLLHPSSRAHRGPGCVALTPIAVGRCSRLPRFSR